MVLDHEHHSNMKQDISSTDIHAETEAHPKYPDIYTKINDMEKEIHIDRT